VGLIHGILTAFFPPQPEPLDDVRVGERALVRGLVVPRDLIESPLTGDRCVYYQYTVEDWRQTKFSMIGGDGFWQLTDRDEAIAEFYIQDAGVRAIVAPHRAKVERGRGVAPRRVPLGMVYRRAQQLLILPGDFIELEGVIDRADDLFDDGRPYRAPTDRLMVRAPDGGELLIRLVNEAAATAL
jgi:hypothetical protein